MPNWKYYAAAASLLIVGIPSAAVYHGYTAEGCASYDVGWSCSGPLGTFSVEDDPAIGTPDAQLPFGLVDLPLPDSISLSIAGNTDRKLADSTIATSLGGIDLHAYSFELEPDTGER